MKSRVPNPNTRTLRTSVAGSLPNDRLWSQSEAAYFLRVSTRYLRESDCPKVLLPGNGAKGHEMVRYDPADVKAWAENRNTKRVVVRVT